MTVGRYTLPPAERAARDARLAASLGTDWVAEKSRKSPLECDFESLCATAPPEQRKAPAKWTPPTSCRLPANLDDANEGRRRNPYEDEEDLEVPYD